MDCTTRICEASALITRGGPLSCAWTFGSATWFDGELVARRPVVLKLSGLWYFVVVPPDSKYDFHEPKPLWIDAGVELLGPEVSSVKLPELPEGAFTFWMYVNDWNAFIHVAAMHANVESPPDVT